MWNAPLKLLIQATRNYVSASMNTLERNLAYWRTVANQIDNLARSTIPISYLLILVALFSMDMSDNYEQGEANDAEQIVVAALGDGLESTQPAAVLEGTGEIGATGKTQRPVYFMDAGMQTTTVSAAGICIMLSIPAVGLFFLAFWNSARIAKKNAEISHEEAARNADVEGHSVTFAINEVSKNILKKTHSLKEHFKDGVTHKLDALTHHHHPHILAGLQHKLEVLGHLSRWPSWHTSSSHTDEEAAVKSNPVSKPSIGSEDTSQAVHLNRWGGRQGSRGLAHNCVSRLEPSATPSTAMHTRELPSLHAPRVEAQAAANQPEPPTQGQTAPQTLGSAGTQGTSAAAISGFSTVRDTDIRVDGMPATDKSQVAANGHHLLEQDARYLREAAASSLQFREEKRQTQAILVEETKKRVQAVLNSQSKAKLNKALARNTNKALARNTPSVSSGPVSSSSPPPLRGTWS